MAFTLSLIAPFFAERFDYSESISSGHARCQLARLFEYRAHSPPGFLLRPHGSAMYESEGGALADGCVIRVTAGKSDASNSDAAPKKTARPSSRTITRMSAAASWISISSVSFFTARWPARYGIS